MKGKNEKDFFLIEEKKHCIFNFVFPTGKIDMEENTKKTKK